VEDAVLHVRDEMLRAEIGARRVLCRHAGQATPYSAAALSCSTLRVTSSESDASAFDA